MDVNQQDIYGNTALHHAIMTKDADSLSILLLSPRVASHTANRDKRTVYDLIDLDDTPFSHTTKICCFARVLIDTTIHDYFLAHKQKVIDAVGETSRLATLQEVIRQIYGYAWFMKEHRDMEFPLYEFPLDVQNKIIEHRLIHLASSCIQK